jgi:uncharacterized membrane protein/nitrite reductase/ring-hydroxylating ferredoxin subunit
MRSKAHIKSHPLHPILVSFPISFFVGAFLFDFLGYIQKNADFWTIGYYLEAAGIIFGLLAAIPGIIDYLTIVPPKSSAKVRATQHGLLNIFMVIIFLLIWIFRKNNSSSSSIILVGEFMGVILIGITGWLGGSLIYRNQIAVDHRYAQAGKWKEKYFKGKSPIEIGKENELEIDQMMLVHINKRRIVIGRTEEGLVAFDDRCTHRGGTLADGVMACGVVQCPWHGSQFDVKTGKVQAGPARGAIKCYSLKISDGKIFLTL